MSRSIPVAEKGLMWTNSKKKTSETCGGKKMVTAACVVTDTYGITGTCVVSWSNVCLES